MDSVYYHKNFKKQFNRLPKNIQKKFAIRLAVFLLDPYSVELNNHSLAGEWREYRSIDITGDIRAVYKVEDKINLFVAIGSHSQLYEK
jgi:addiction module RelE/StbE family toxin